MSKQLPARPHLEQLRKQAKVLLKGHKAADPHVLRLIQELHPRWKDADEAAVRDAKLLLADAQLLVAREYGFESWAKLKAEVLRRSPEPEALDAFRDAAKELRDAAGRGDLARMTALLDAHPEIIDDAGGQGVRTALHQAVFGRQKAAMRLLLERGADPNIRCEGDNAYPLHFAAEQQNLPLIRLLVEAGGDTVGEGDYHELGVLGWACGWPYVDTKPEVVEYLLAHGAQHNIFSATALGDVEAIRKLVTQSRENLNRRMDMGNRRRRPLHLAAINKQPQAVAALLDLGADKEALDEAGFTPLDQAALNGQTEIAQMLVEHGSKVRLPAALALGRGEDVARLVRRDPECLKEGGRWEKLIVRMAERSPGSVIEALIAAGADVNVRDEPKTAIDMTSGFTPLHSAAWYGNLSAADALLCHGANVRAREEKWHGTPAGWADYSRHTEVRDRILQGPIDIIETIQYRLPERTAEVLREDPGALERPFAEYGLYPTVAEGWFTPLAFAVSEGATQMVRFLLDNGADRAGRSPEDLSLVEMAEAKGYPEIAAMLRD
jgi:ankyrin repeat protein